MNAPKTYSLVLATALLVGLLLVVGTVHTSAQSAERTAQGPLPAKLLVAAAQEGEISSPIVRHAVRNDQSPPLRSIPPRRPLQVGQAEILRFPLPGRQEGRRPAPAVSADSAVQNWQGSSAMPSPIRSFDGIGSVDNEAAVGFQVMPPDTQGDVGPNHYIQWVNLAFAIWDKSGKLLYGPAAGSSLWSGFGGPCEYTNDGDPITLYDALAGRWLMSQFALPNHPDGPFYQCVAVSVSGDPTGSWYRYAYEWHNGAGQDVMNDYPKFGVWPDGYYMTVNQFSAGTSGWAGTGVAVLERTEMLRGRSARMVYLDLGPADWGGMLPADLDGLALPPAGSPNYLVEAHADEWDPTLDDELVVHQFHVDWTNPGQSTFAQVARLPMAPFDGNLCGFSGNCIPQPGTAQRLDAIADRLMYRLQYRNMGTYETLVSNLTVDVDGTDRAGIRWFELRRSQNAWSIHQQGTYAPDGNHRWMGSIAMDRAGNIALGYSAASDSLYPSIRYAGRLANDPLGTLPQAEVPLAIGSASQAGASRWGDYSMMALDPVDDCTFWYTQEYVSSPGEWGNWNTRIGAFQFPGCLGPTGTIEGRVREETTGATVAGARVTAHSNPTYATYSQPPDGFYRFQALPPGTYDLAVEAYGYQFRTISGLTVAANNTTRQDFSLSPMERYVLSGRVTDATTGWPLYASIEIDGYLGDLVWTDPATGLYSVTLSAGLPYTLHVTAWAEGYHPAERALEPLTQDHSEDVALTADAEACVAPGYMPQIIGIQQRFENGGSLPAGWKTVDNASNNQVWAFNDPGLRGNKTGGSGGFAIVDSDFYGWGGHQDTELRTPTIDFTGVAQVRLEFDTDYFTYVGSGTDDVADVDVSSDNGKSWTNVWRKTGTSYRGPAHEMIDISALAAGKAKVVVRFYYYNAFWEWWWQVDNILVGQDLGCQPQSGGLVVGSVYDDNTGQPLAGAQVANDSGRTTVTKATPLDPKVDDGLYVLFSPGGSHTLSATMANGYGADAQVVVVPPGGVVHQDFFLPMGWLTYDPDSMDVTLTMGEITTLPLQLANQGGQALTLQIGELEVGYEPPGPAQYVEVKVPSAVLSYGADARVAKRRTTFRPELQFAVRQMWRPSGQIQVLLLTPDVAAGGDTQLLENTLAAFPDLEVSLWEAAQGAPAGEDLAAYDLVIVGNDFLWTAAGMDREAVGDALADYLDAGGKVIETLFAHDYQGWQLGGRYVWGGYAPLIAGTRVRTATPSVLGRVHDPAHPILAGVAAVRDTPTTGIAHQDAQPAPGATRLADWDDGDLFVAYKGNVVGVNQLWFHGANWTGDVPTLMHNAILYLSAADLDWLSAVPTGGTIDAAGQLNVPVGFNGGAPSVTQPGRYRAMLYLENDTAYGDPALPVTMTILAGPVCTDVTGVDLTLVNTGPITTDTPVRFRAELLPAAAAPPFGYAMNYGDSTPPERGTSQQNPFVREHTYTKAGTYTAKIAAWNCQMPEPEAVAGQVAVGVSRVDRHTYLPVVLRGG